VLALSVALLLASAVPASASVGETIILRCTHGQTLGGFSQQAYGEALADLNAVTEEYSECASLIRQAQLAAALGRGGSGGGASVVPIVPTPAEKLAIEHVVHSTPAPVLVGNEVVRPGVVRASIASSLSSLPRPLLALISLLLACLLVVGGGAARNRLRAQRNR
jgi:hypothetical protein